MRSGRSLLLCVLLSTLALAQVQAPMLPPSLDRNAPPEIAPIVQRGVRYEARASDEGVLFAVDDQTGALRWSVRVYAYQLDPMLESDVQSVFIKSMELSGDGDTLLIEDESGVRHQVDLKTRKASALTWGVTLKAVEAVPAPGGWRYSVQVEIRNRFTRAIKLDGQSVAEGGALANDLFEVTVDGTPVRYRGKMASRAPPARFLELRPGETYSVVVALGEQYPVPPGKHRVSVRFSHHNHFSPDDFDLESLPISIDVEGPGFQLRAKPTPR